MFHKLVTQNHKPVLQLSIALLQFMYLLLLFYNHTFQIVIMTLCCCRDVTLLFCYQPQ
jgi:hypothetical protein